MLAKPVGEPPGVLSPPIQGTIPIVWPEPPPLRGGPLPPNRTWTVVPATEEPAATAPPTYIVEKLSVRLSVPNVIEAAPNPPPPPN